MLGAVVLDHGIAFFLVVEDCTKDLHFPEGLPGKQRRKFQLEVPKPVPTVAAMAQPAEGNEIPELIGAAEF